ncbi:hypothetical protein CHGG_00750 [Chaetomium globosum CBS 148.51]|uniref:Myb-like domain-containing protein n=1 Tax=Chaetomium globosum (strain ATCC 6205 / CBS 148.51 / DSM 1962 / NBRC 6347 / NRRL 1970) TaxID=306901 RepID=Q2HGA4_CHAGB|nr:uncharacterized protein CHGG_00750 [Chaetomium globosum CBS 148.51]EAQ92515.1 hypothetical protein CHGG_00750 [Chaetomium globosum CBS 148.51]
MLMPSALPCDSSQTPPLPRLQAALFTSPPASPPQVSPQTAIGNIFSTCRSLQSLLTNPATPSIAQEPITPPASSHAQLPTPPLAHAPPPLKLRLRSRKTDSAAPTGDHGPTRKRIVKRTASVAQQAAAPRGPNKRRRAADDELGRYNEDDSDMEHDVQEHSPEQQEQPQEDDRPEESPPHTPKRARIAPEVIPLGLERADYHSLHSSFSSTFSGDGDTSTGHTSPDTEMSRRGTDVVLEADGSAWSTEEDRMLVELVLEKLKLTKSDWQDCARSLGKDRATVGRRWKSLMLNGGCGAEEGRVEEGEDTWDVEVISPFVKGGFLDVCYSYVYY